MSRIRRLILLLTVSLIASFSNSNASADLIFSLESHSADQAGHTLSGLIVTTDNAINDGYLTSGEIINWQFSTTGPNSISVSSLDAGAAIQIDGDVRIDANAITLEEAPFMSGFLNRIEMRTPTGRVFWHRDEFFGFQTDIYHFQTSTTSGWSTTSPNMSGTDPWLVASRVTSVPEPSSLTMASILLSGLLVRRKRSRS